MLIPDSMSKTGDDGAGWFATTHWSVVLAAGRSSAEDGAAALEKLCRTYWYPLYAYVRRWGHSPEDAQDLTQGFFAAFLERNGVARADRERGRFRTFLLGSIENFLHAERDRAGAQKRGGGTPMISLDADPCLSINYYQLINHITNRSR